MLMTDATAVGSGIPGEFPTVRTETSASTSGPVTRSIPWRTIVLAVYAVGVFVLLGRLIAGTLHAQRLIRQGVRRAEFLTSSACSAPVTVGWIRPVVILPEGWESWSEGQREAVMLHEQEHARRRDPLIQWVALANRAVFWFHPLAWWLERHLAELAEDACDTVVLSKGHQATAYCEYLLSMARAVTGAGARLNVVGAAMPGAFLSRRIRRILGGAPESRLSASRLVLTLVASTAASVALIAGTLAPDAQPQPESRQSVTGQTLSEDWFADDEWHLETAPLMSAPDTERYKRLRTVADRDAFVSDFWKRHDHTPGTAANEFQREFERRIRYAKEHYADADSAATFGYQTDRGRWYVMSGPPDAVRVFGTRRVDANGRTGEIEEWAYQSLDDLGSNVSVRFDRSSNFGCTYRGGKYRIVSPSPVRRFDGVTSAGSDRRPYAQIYPGHFVYLSFPIDEQAVAIRWGMRTGRDGQLILDEENGPIDYVQGEIGSVSDDPTRSAPNQSRPAEPILQHLQGMRFFEPGGIACTEQLPPAAYTLRIETRLLNGTMRSDSVTFTVD
jgi:GWxTD domain-containing protein